MSAQIVTFRAPNSELRFACAWNAARAHRLQQSDEYRAALTEIGREIADRVANLHHTERERIARMRGWIPDGPEAA